MSAISSNSSTNPSTAGSSDPNRPNPPVQNGGANVGRVAAAALRNGLSTPPPRVANLGCPGAPKKTMKLATRLDDRSVHPLSLDDDPTHNPDGRQGAARPGL